MGIDMECPAACYPPPMSECAVTETVCDMGMDMNGCWMGDYCMPEGEVCPPPPVTCPEMTASICDETSVNCDMGGDANGCWLGDLCQPMDLQCPSVEPPTLFETWEWTRTDVGWETTACQLE